MEYVLSDLACCHSLECNAFADGWGQGQFVDEPESQKAILTQSA